MKGLNILVADDHPLFREGLRGILYAMEAFKEIHEASNGADAVQITRKNLIDLVFTDYRMPVMNGYIAAKNILSQSRPPKIILLSNYDSIPLILNFFKLGVKGFLTKEADRKSISHAIRSVMCGDYYYESRFDDEITQELKFGLSTKIPAIKFSDREMQVITRVSMGMTNQEIASDLNVSIRTIETYRYDLISKTKVSNTAELVDFVYKNGII